VRPSEIKHRGTDRIRAITFVEWSEADDAVIADIVATVRERQHLRSLRPPTKFGRSLVFGLRRGSTGIDLEGFVAVGCDDPHSRDGSARPPDRHHHTLRGEWIESIFEPEVILEVRASSEWSEHQRSYFGLDEPYQTAEGADAAPTDMTAG
jgi:hypothetical protein